MESLRRRQSEAAMTDLARIAIGMRAREGKEPGAWVQIALVPCVWALVMDLVGVAWLEAHHIVLAPRGH